MASVEVQAGWVTKYSSFSSGMIFNRTAVDGVVSCSEDERLGSDTGCAGLRKHNRQLQPVVCIRIVRLWWPVQYVRHGLRSSWSLGGSVLAV